MIGMIWAQAHHRVIGKNGTMAWHLPPDIAMFKQTTSGHAVVMGRKTWESLAPQYRPLANRENYVLTRDTTYLAEGATVGHELAELLAQVEAENPEKIVWVMGGANVYTQALAYADVLVVTDVDLEIASGEIASETRTADHTAANGATKSNDADESEDTSDVDSGESTSNNTPTDNTATLAFAPDFGFDWRLLAASPNRGWHRSKQGIPYRFSVYVRKPSPSETELTTFEAKMTEIFDAVTAKN